MMLRTIVATVLLIVLAVFGCRIDAHRKLKNSASAFAERCTIHSPTFDKPREVVYPLLFADAGAFWRVQPAKVLDLTNLSATCGLKIADAADQNYYKQEFGLIFSDESWQPDFSTYTLYRTDMVLGPGTICPSDQNACAVYFLVGNENAYLSLNIF